MKSTFWRGVIIAACTMFALTACENKEEQPVKQEQPVAKVEAKPEAPKRVVAHVEVPVVNWSKALEMNQAGGLFLDVRTPEELNEGFVDQTLKIPLAELKRRMGELPKDKDLLVYCRSGRRSEVAVKLLMNAGFDRAYSVKGGYSVYPNK